MISRMSLLLPLRPSRPHFLLKKASASAWVMPILSAMRRTAAGSMSPERVPMTRPSRGVMPMEVSTTLPFSTAAMLLPLPRWQVMRLKESRGRSRNLAVASETKWWEVPWKP